MKETLAAIKDRFSTRGYTDEKLTKEELDTILTAGLQAPTAANRQEIHITVIEKGNPILDELQTELLKGRPGAGRSFYYDAPLLMILSGPESFRWSACDAGIAVQSMALAAESLSLGSLIIGCIYDAMTGEKKAYFNEKLQIPEGNAYQVAFAVGHKNFTKEPHTYSMEKNVTKL
ncbi:MAG: nitroreductase family protein [Firmicutes bacterium]|nr:nitroreductase family protein [Bacillota bacterium]